VPGAGSHALLTRPPLPSGLDPRTVRLACVRRAASVRSEPGSNSQLHPPPLTRNPRRGGRSGPTASLHKAAPGPRSLRLAPRGRSKATAREPRQHPARGKLPSRRLTAPQQQPPPAAPTDSAPPPSPGCLSPRPNRPPPTHPFLPYSTCPKNNPTPAATHRRACSAGKRRLIVAKAVRNKPFLPPGPALTFKTKWQRQH
jgi:hypothetical protein